MLSVKDTAHGQSWDERQMVLGGPSSEVEGRTGPERHLYYMHVSMQMYAVACVTAGKGHQGSTDTKYSQIRPCNLLL